MPCDVCHLREGSCCISLSSLSSSVCTGVASSEMTARVVWCEMVFLAVGDLWDITAGGSSVDGRKDVDTTFC